jgi:cold-inducible RNA-binding protein
MSMKLYVGNLSFGTMEDDLQRLFSQVGSVESIAMVTDRDTGRSRGFAFVEMASKSEGEAAIAKFNGSELDGRSLTVSEARPRETNGGGFGGDRNGGGRGGSFGRGRGSGSSRY